MVIRSIDDAMLRARLLLLSLVLSAVPATLFMVGCATAQETMADGRPVPSPAHVAALETARAPAAAFAGALAGPALRAQAVLALGRLERLDAAAAILAALDDTDVTVRENAAFAAGQLDLAITTGVAAHEAVALEVEARLIGRLAAEKQPAVRLAVVRALGRLARTAGRIALLMIARSPDLARGTALQALGVSFQRRPGGDDDVVRAAVAEGLGATSTEVQAAAAYLALRVGGGLTAAQAGSIGGRAPQARIYLTRALGSPKTTTAVVDATLPSLLTDSDWRVRVEALRAIATHPDATIGPVLSALPQLVARIADAGNAHVVTEACTTLAAVGAPGASLPVVQAAVNALPAGATWSHARCTCAGVVEVLGGPGQTLETCTASLPPVLQRLLSVQTVALARISSIERTAALKTFLADDDSRVRIAAAHAMCADGSLAAADAAATRLLTESDPGSMSALLECFADGQNDDVIKDRTLTVAAQRLQAANRFEDLEPLTTVATLARARTGAGARALVEQLAAHPDPRVKDAARGVRGGDRAAGPRAKSVEPPAAATLPLAIILHTARGEIVIGLDRERAPRAVATFVELARAGVVDGTPFHRVIADFVAQGGDPRGDGSGGPGFSIADEPADVSFVRGAVGIAHAGKDTGGSQFFITHSDQPHLDGRYTMFGTVVDGQAVVDALQPNDQLLSVEVSTALRPRR